MATTTDHQQWFLPFTPFHNLLPDTGVVSDKGNEVVEMQVWILKPPSLISTCKDREVMDSKAVGGSEFDRERQGVHYVQPAD